MRGGQVLGEACPQPDAGENIFERHSALSRKLNPNPLPLSEDAAGRRRLRPHDAAADHIHRHAQSRGLLHDRPQALSIEVGDLGPPHFESLTAGR